MRFPLLVRIFNLNFSHAIPWQKNAQDYINFTPPPETEIVHALS